VARRQVAATTGGTLVLDAEGVAKAAANDQRVLAHLAVALRRQARVVVSTVTLAEILRGSPRDAPVHRVLNRVSHEPVTEHLGRAAGALLGTLLGTTRLPGTAIVDAVVAATALDQPGPVLILTSDPGDLRTLTQTRDDIAVAHV
jgi:predicted nucleic acid-binding protein